MLQVLCSTVELEEYGEVLAVGDQTERLAARTRCGYYGTELDDVAWSFDRYATLSAGEDSTIAGRVTAIAAIYVRLTLEKGRGWVPSPGTAWLEPIESTAMTRVPSPRIAWGSYSPPDERGHSYRGGYPIIEEGDEQLSGWRVTLDDEQVSVADPATSPRSS